MLDVLSEEDILRYEQRATQELGDECARWLQAGEAREVAL